MVRNGLTRMVGWMIKMNAIGREFYADQDVVIIGGAEGALQSNNCRGSIPADLALLSTCSILNLGLNPEIGGSIPTSLTTMTKLVTLYFNG